MAYVGRARSALTAFIGAYRRTADSARRCGAYRRRAGSPGRCGLRPQSQGVAPISGHPRFLAEPQHQPGAVQPAAEDHRSAA